jgi:hypothetical protein
MSRVVLIGEGPLPSPKETETAFAQLRLHQLHEALRAAHDVALVDIRSDDVGAALRDHRPLAVVTAGIHGPTRAALAHIGDQPLCIDLPGDPFADAQMVAAAGGAAEVAADARAVFVPALARGDVFLTIGGPSRHALIGQLGLLGRTAVTPLEHEWGLVTPISWSFPGLPEGEPRPRERLPRVALVGGFNTWFDDETLLAGLLLAMDRSRLEVVCIGGPIPGHHTESWARFSAAARTSRHARRFTFHDRAPAAQLADLLAPCSVGVVLDRPGYEPELGSRTRLLLYLHQGLSVVSTTRCELARELAAGGWIRPVPCADPTALAHSLLLTDPLPDRAPLRARYSVDATTQGLREWLRRPRRAAVPADTTALLAITRERDALRAELQRVYGSPTWKAMDRLRRLAGPR